MINEYVRQHQNQYARLNWELACIVFRVCGGGDDFKFLHQDVCVEGLKKGPILKDTSGYKTRP